MKKKNLLSLCTGVLTIAFTSMMLIGCGTKSSNVTMGDVIEKMETTEINSGLAVISGSYQYGYLESQETKIVDMNIEMDMKWTEEPIAMYLKQKVEVNTEEEILGDLEDANMELYFVKEDDSYVLYQGVAGGQWNCIRIDGDNLEQYSDLISENNTTLNVNSFTEEQLKTTCTNENASVNGRKAYEFIYTGTFAEMEDILSEVMEGVSDVIDLSLSDKEIVVRMYIDKETYYPLSSIIEIKETTKSNDSEEATEEHEQMWINNCKMSITYSEINEVEAIIVPKEVKENAIDFSDWFDGWLSE